MTNDLDRLARNRSHRHELHGGALTGCTGNDDRSASASRYTATERPESRCYSAHTCGRRGHCGCRRPARGIASGRSSATWGMSVFSSTRRCAANSCRR
jgi:hypothetical protein